MLWVYISDYKSSCRNRQKMEPSIDVLKRRSDHFQKTKPALKVSQLNEHDGDSDSYHPLTSGDESSSSFSSPSSRQKRRTKRPVVRRTGSHLRLILQFCCGLRKLASMLRECTSRRRLASVRQKMAALKALHPPRPMVHETIQSFNRKHTCNSEGDPLRGEPSEVCSNANISISF